MKSHTEATGIVIDHLKGGLKARDDVHAFWLEGSIPQGYADEFSDLDLWLSVDDDKVFAIYEVIENILGEIAPIDFKYTVKHNGQLGHNVYHLEGTDDFLTIDINTQGLSRDVYLVKGIDEAEVIFDKNNVVKFEDRKDISVNIEAKRNKLQAFYVQMLPNVLKNIRRHKPLEALYYYHLILRYTTRFLRLKYNWQEKTDFDLKHIYRDVPEHDVDKLEQFYDVKLSDIEEKLPKLKEWIRGL